MLHKEKKLILLIAVQFFFKTKIYLLQSYIKRTLRSLTCWFMPARTQWPELEQSEAGSQELFLVLPSGCSSPSTLNILNCFPRTLAGNQIGSGASRNQISMHMGCWHLRWQLYLISHSTRPLAHSLGHWKSTQQSASTTMSEHVQDRVQSPFQKGS